MDTPRSSDPADQTLHSWQKLSAALKSVTPAGYLRFSLILAVMGGLAWIIWQSRYSLLPFLVGGVIAYILLPLVNTLDRLMPRLLAVTISLLLMLGSVVFFLYLLVPPLVSQVPNFLHLIPDQAGIQSIIDRLHTMIQTLPGPAQDTVLRILRTASVTLREYLDQNLGNLSTTVIQVLIGVFNSIGFILGFLIVPAWLLTVMKDHQKGVRAVDRFLPVSIQKDFWAIVKIVDRPLRAFVSGQLLLAVAAGIAVYISMTLLEYIGWDPIRYKVPLALWAAVFELIPEVGPYLGAIPAVLGGFYRSPQHGLAVIAVYIVIHYLINRFVGSRVENRIIQLHPAVLLILIVALSQFGFIWVILAAPLISILTNLFRYLYGRLSDPPLPAGVLPGEPVPPAQLVQEPQAYRIPLVYRRSREARR